MIKYNGLCTMAMVEIDDETRDKLRMYKAKEGLTYTEAIEELLANAGENE